MAPAAMEAPTFTTFAAPSTPQLGVAPQPLALVDQFWSFQAATAPLNDIPPLHTGVTWGNGWSKKLTREGRQSYRLRRVVEFWEAFTYAKEQTGDG